MTLTIDSNYFQLDVAIDGADEVDSDLNLIKGGGWVDLWHLTWVEFNTHDKAWATSVQVTTIDCDVQLRLPLFNYLVTVFSFPFDFLDPKNIGASYLSVRLVRWRLIFF